MLNSPLSEEDLVGAMIGHFPPEVQNDMVCGNLKKTQDALAFLSKMHGLEATRLQHTRPRREYDEKGKIRSNHARTYRPESSVTETFR